MSVILAVFLNAGLLAVLLPWLRRQWRWAGSTVWQSVLGVGLALRVGVGLIRNWHPQGDAAFMSFVSHIITAKMKSEPATTWDILTRAVTVLPQGTAMYDFVFQNTSNTWILIKILAVLNLASLETDWLNAVYLSLFAFVGCWQLVRAFANCFPGTPAGAGAVAFLFWPTVFFWASGISKEAVLLGSGAWLTARVVDYCYGRAGAVMSGWAWVRWGLATAGLALLHFGIRYFFAVPLLITLCGVVLGRWLERYTPMRSRWARAAALTVVLAAGAWGLPRMGVAFSLNKFTNQVITVYSFELAHSVGRPHFEYSDLRPTIESITAYAPLAAVNVITRPWLGESWQPLYVAASLENAALLALLAWALFALMRKRGGHLPFELGLGLALFCLMLAILIGLTTPNLGSLHRYRCELVPFLVLLLLQNDFAAQVLSRLGLAR